MACHYCDRLIRKLRGSTAIAKCKISNYYFWVSMENFDSFVTGVNRQMCFDISGFSGKLVVIMLYRAMYI